MIKKPTSWNKYRKSKFQNITNLFRLPTKVSIPYITVVYSLMTAESFELALLYKRILMFAFAVSWPDFQ